MWWVSHPGVEDAYEHADHEYREERIEWVGANGAERATQPSEQSHSKGDSLQYCTRTRTLLTGTGATCSTSTVLPLPLPYYVVRLYPATAKAHTHQLPPPVGFSKTASQGALPLPHTTRLPHTQQARSMFTYYCMASAGPRMRRAPLRASTGRQRKSRARVRRVLVQTRSAAAHC